MSIVYALSRHRIYYAVGCPRNEKKNVSVRTETNRNKICFAFVSVCFVKPKQIFFGLFRCFEPISKLPKQTERFRNKPKQSGSFWKIPKYALYQNLELLNGVWMCENRSETLKEYTYDTSGFGRACAPVHCAHPSFFAIATPKGRKTVTAMDVVYALKRQGRTLYRFGG